MPLHLFVVTLAGFGHQVREARNATNGVQLELETIEATPVAQSGRVVDLKLTHKSAARDLIEDFMIASNVAIAKWLEARGRSGIRRIVREPERWARIVELASRYGERLPNEPDSLALSRFLAKRRRRCALLLARRCFHPPYCSPNGELCPAISFRTLSSRTFQVGK